MKTRHQVHNLIILDESGSMYSIWKKTIRYTDLKFNNPTNQYQQVFYTCYFINLIEKYLPAH